MATHELPTRILAAPKAELHLHLEGSIRPQVAVKLAARHGVALTEDDVRRQYAYTNFTEFIEAFKWVTSFLRDPADFALIAADLAEQLLAQKVSYAEVTLSVGVMLLRKQNPQANFEALLAATVPFERKGLRLNWIYDAVRQFGPDLAQEVVDWAKQCNSSRIVAFGIGGDELSGETKDFKRVYERATACGLHRLIHAGEIGGPEKIREAVELLGVERIGHGIAAIHDRALMDLLAARRIVLEICPASNLLTGALAAQLRRTAPSIREHPLPRLVRHGIPVVLSTDDPSMFHTSLREEYQHAHDMGLGEVELAQLVENGFSFSFLSEDERNRLNFRTA
ncbi:MAG TPA: adenosine deaminase [Candidatus Sulfotelmatobacter sp.]|nr:adenosine deaminase [Candidatus Sulfotelmatobacter sp.]